MKKLVICIFLGLLVGMAPVMAQMESSSPKLIALKFHADWCGGCKAMGPVFTDLQNHFDGTPVLFVVLDFTNKTSKHHSKMMAAGLGLKEVMMENKGTGFILLVDANTKKVVKKLSSSDSMKTMAMAIKEKI